MSSNTMVPYNVLSSIDMPHISGTKWNKEMFINALDNTSSLLTLIEKGINDGDDVLGLLSFIGLTALEAIPIVGGVLSSLVSILFFPTKSSIDFQKIWEHLEKAINQIVDKKIEEALMSQLMQEIAGLVNVLEEYRDAYDSYNGKKVFDIPDKLTPEEYLVQVFTSANLLFIQRIPAFQNPKYDVLFLPFFVHVAEMHILLIRDAAIHGLEWGMDEEIHQKFKRNLKEIIDEYTSYLLKTYKKGLKEVSERELNDKDFPTTINKYNYINTVRWNVINQYKRGMTLTVFDFAYKWKYYQEIYQNNIELNPFRTIYSDIAGSVYPYEKTTNEIDTIIKDHNLKYRGIFKRLQVNHAERIDSIQSSYIQNNEIIDSERTGGTGGRESVLDIESPVENPLIQVNMWSELVPISLGFKFYNEKEKNIGGGSWWPNPHKFGAYQYVGNKVSSIMGIGKNATGGFNSLDAMVVAFKRDDYTQENRIIGVNEKNEFITKVIDAGNFYQSKFESNVTMIDEPIFGDGVLQFENNSSNTKQNSYVTYQIRAEIGRTYELHAVIGAKKQKDKVALKVSINGNQPENITTDSFDDGDIWDGMSVNDGFVYKRVLIGRFQLEKGLNKITIYNGVLQNSASAKMWNLAALELTIPDNTKRNFENGDFSKGLEGWKIEEGSPSVDNQYLNMCLEKSKVSQTIRVHPNTTYELSYDILTGSQNNSRDYGILYLDFLSIDESIISNISHSIKQQEGSWAKKTYKFKTPSDIRELKLTIAKEYSNHGFYIDNIDVKEVKTELKWNFENGDFSMGLEGWKVEKGNPTAKNQYLDMGYSSAKVSQTIRMFPSTTYELSYDFLTGDQNNHMGYGTLYLDFISMDGFIHSGGSSIIEQQPHWWAKKTYKFKTPPNIRELKLTIDKGQFNQNFYIDNIVVKKILLSKENFIEKLT
ncbi:insecticidal delta-endotoxin Cry8Ea1 family protein [Bacillus thuringiensis]|uniref:insecticidal delta-endotoxin Cry8Ea1 family protein n=1 Tax=Bacillus thuringiensis TaxID=1428 RepID=UPI0021EFC785|nr:insecticidal delta-endotoxin Cry8Ea1 family protein [Bacillus thuringiensis]MEC2708062.1 insecticidal delta-endotoxin Cry8Ea1 family protein [Bacillus thuringiensis]HDR7163295.1 hypothetical protein [Bacillus cereus]